ncbi:MAG: Rossmann-like and DUF2520 domain-containing protein [Candidatus Aminicenantales bacterium]
MKRFSIVGAGRVGTALGFALTRKGWELAAIVDREAAAARESRKIIGRGRGTTDLGHAGRGVQVLFICVPDDAIGAVAKKLAGAGSGWSGRLVFHTSGLVAASALDPLRAQGASVASLHPVQAFPGKKGGARLFSGIYWGLEGDGAAVKAGRGIVKTLGGRSFILLEKDKPLYHAACSLASTAFISLEGAAAALLEEAGIPRNSATAILLPLVQGTLQNVKKLGLKNALTGPLVRGDVRTVRRHLEVLRSRPLHLEIYKSLGRQALGFISGGRVPAGKVRALRRLLEGR